jgi:crotonobetainyl-CoA:carnitine CoA-transferase CaiB-like acyl-CoA transferase
MRGLGGLSPTGQHSGAYLHLNRGKRNICLDLKKLEAKEVMDRLIESVDVIVANMRPQALQKLGIDADSIRSRFPEKIYCLITGYGTDGPYAGLPTYDSVVQGVTGMAGLFLKRDGAPNYVPMLICDHVAGEIAAGSILAAIVEYQSTGKGCTIEVPMFETMAGFVLQEHLAQQSFEPPVGPAGDLRLLSPQNKPVQTSDGWISFTVNTDSQVRAFLNATGRSDLLNDERFVSVAARAKYVKEWFEVRGSPLTHMTTDEWLELFQKADIAAQPCHTLETLQHDKHLKAVGLISQESHPTEGTVAAIRASIRVDDGYLDVRSTAQPKGWDSKALLAEMGFEQEHIEAMLNSGAVVSSSSNP